MAGERVAKPTKGFVVAVCSVRKMSRTSANVDALLRHLRRLGIPARTIRASLKTAMPAIIGRGYDNLDISDGQVASAAFLAATYGEMPEEDRANVMSDLEHCCGRDTEGMIWIVERLKELCD